MKIKTLGELQAALGVVKSLMTREHALDDALMSGVATALCAEFIEALKYLDGAEPYQEPCYGHLADSIILIRTADPSAVLRQSTNRLLKIIMPNANSHRNRCKGISRLQILRPV